jgi:hypothetical protein
VFVAVGVASGVGVAVSRGVKVGLGVLEGVGVTVGAWDTISPRRQPEHPIRIEVITKKAIAFFMEPFLSFPWN